MRWEGALPTAVVTMVIPDTKVMYNKTKNSIVFDLYEVGSPREGGTSLPFVHGVELAGPKGEVVRFRSVFDDGALVNAIDETPYRTLKGRLSAPSPSEKVLRMADGRLVPSAGVWKGKVTVKGVSRESAFEIFKSNGAWAMLFGKPLLRTFNAIHDYTEDSIRILQEKGPQWVVLSNQFATKQGFAAKLLANRTTDIKQLLIAPPSEPTQASEVGEAVPKQKEGEDPKELGDDSNTYKIQGGLTTPLEGSLEIKPPSTPKSSLTNPVISPHDIPPEQNKHTLDENPNPVWLLNNTGHTEDENITYSGAEQPDVSKVFEPTILTRKTDPHNPARVAAILAEVTIGSDLTTTQEQQVREMISRHAECFALSMSEVTPVEGAAHRLDIPRDKQFRTKVNQRPQTPPQREFFNSVIDKMLDAGIIRPIAHQDVKCCGATTLAKKAHEGDGLTLDILKDRVNSECVTAGFPTAFENLPPAESPTINHDTSTPTPQNKWRVCQDFAELNKVTKVPPMPQGDIRRKQQNLSGHRWITVFDFANGFYACEIKPEDQPYVCFYVEGRGYYAYMRMPFGLTGAPSTFGGMTAAAIGDFTGTLIELFVDDGGLAGDVFETMLADTERLLQRIGEKGLSLSASKSKFFVTEATFAGGRVGPDGIKPDLTKLTAVANWKKPTDLQNLGSFLGLTGYFRPLIKGYATIAQPLTDMARKLELPKFRGKAAYTKAMKGYSLEGLWDRYTTKHFSGSR